MSWSKASRKSRDQQRIAVLSTHPEPDGHMLRRVRGWWAFSIILLLCDGWTRQSWRECGHSGPWRPRDPAAQTRWGQMGENKRTDLRCNAYNLVINCIESVRQRETGRWDFSLALWKDAGAVSFAENSEDRKRLGLQITPVACRHVATVRIHCKYVSSFGKIHSSFLCVLLRGLVLV